MTKKSAKKIDKKDDVLASVMDSINDGEVKMKSKWFFVGLSVLLLASTCLMVMAISVVMHVIWNDVDVARAAQVLEFGSPGRAFILRNAPWILLLALVVMFLTLYHLINKFEISHKHRHLAPILLFAGVIFSGLILSVSGLNERLGDNTLGRFKSIEEALEKDYVAGEIQEIYDDYIIIESEETEYRIRMPYKEKLKGKLPNLFKEGQQVKVFGEYEGDEFEAYGIVPPDFNRKVKGLRDLRDNRFENLEIIPSR